MKLVLEQNDVSLISQKEKFSVENLVCLFSVRSFFPNFSNKQKQAVMSCGDMSLGCVMSFRCIHFPLMSFQMHSTCPLRSLDYMYISEFYISTVGGWGGFPLRSALWVFLTLPLKILNNSVVGKKKFLPTRKPKFSLTLSHKWRVKNTNGHDPNAGKKKCPISV